MPAQDPAVKKKPSGGVGKSLQRAFMKGQVSLYRLTNGKVGGGEHLLILTTTGRKSGVKRDTPLFFFRDEGHHIIIASAGGAEKHPTWWLNLKSNPQATIQVGANVIPVTAQEAEGTERERLWSIIADNYKQFVGYQKRTTRTIPVIVLTPNA
ncbi:deazaflavin-dependent nitroreductase [Ktedonobacteria bacterium brp13]|nr:deazaflavin-dependent nitroreductase [Ktedonobacteria bacterium brp13]